MTAQITKRIICRGVFIELLSQINDYLSKCYVIMLNILLLLCCNTYGFSLYMLCTGFCCWKTHAYWTTVLFKYWSDTLVVKSAALWTQSFIINLSCIWTASSRLEGLYSLKRRLSTASNMWERALHRFFSRCCAKLLKHFYNREYQSDLQRPQRNICVRHSSCVTGGEYEKVTRSEQSVRNCLHRFICQRTEDHHHGCWIFLALQRKDLGSLKMCVCEGGGG